MSLPEYIDIQGFEYSKGKINPVKISLSTEFAFTVRINGSPYTEIACSGTGMEEFAIGHMLSNNIIRSKNDISDIIVDESRKDINIITDLSERMLERLLSVKFIASGCGQAGKVETSDTIKISPPIVDASIIINTMKAFLHHSTHYMLTHGAHSSAIYSSEGEMIAYYEDIGRHNAVDKSIGFAVKNSTDLSNKMIISTGRLSSDIVHKAVNAGIPAVVSRSSTTSMGYEIAARHNIILIGRVKPSSFIIYNGRDYISC